MEIHQCQQKKSESGVAYGSQFQITFSFFNIASELEDLIYQNDLLIFCFRMISNSTDYGTMVNYIFIIL